MFSDALTITINAQAKVLTRINQDRYSSEYMLREATGQYTLILRHTTFADKTRSSSTAVGTKLIANRHNVEFIYTLYPANAGQLPIIRKAYLVFQNDNSDSIVDPVRHVMGLVGFLSEANVTKLIGWES